ncbi:putative protein Shroom2-like [Triplophysa rosa]|uniref:Protein Shroom2 n=1 Tax=Triplophysa rosa TaxID=992332 RepID=A0A9W7TEX0_TRIRA|nr:putative protein Shroom2-like [Triplophysa rosa]
MVDIVTHTMPAESDAHVARNFLTKILRSSMRRNESSCRPHSWNSKSAENPITDIPKSEAESSWPTRYDASSPSKDYTSCWGQTNLRQVSCQFSSVGNMESVEPLAHAFSKESQSNKLSDGVDHSVLQRGLNKPPSFLSGAKDPVAPRSITTTEGMFYRGSPNELTNDCHRYLQIPMSTGGCVSPSIEEHAAFKFSSSGRSNPGPVRHVPDNKPSTAPPPPLRSDSFTATRVHEKGLVGSFPEGFSVYPPSRTVDRHSDDIHASEMGREARHSYNPPPKKDFLHLYLSIKDCNQNQINPSKAFSRSSTDVRQAQNPFTYEVHHQRQHSNESPFAMYPSTACTPKTQSVGSYYQSLQDLPTNSETQNSARTSTTFEHNHEGQSHFRYYCITTQQPCQESSTHPQGLRGNERRTEVGTTPGTIGSQKIAKTKTKYLQPYLNLPENGCTKEAINPPPTEATSPQPPRVFLKSSSSEKERNSPEKNKGGFHHEPNHQTEQKSSPWIIQEEKICPIKTPMLYSLTQESKMIAEKSIVSSKEASHQESSDSIGGKLGRRSDRYATTLRKEIQQKKAQLQKSRSAANLICSSEVEDDSVVWKSNETSTSSSDGSFTNTYKDHLKEAQAKVLKATSFMRRDLELPGDKTSTGQPPKNGQLTCIGGRKRFAMDNKMHSFSEPDKINEVGVEDKAVGSFVDRYQFFESSSKPNFQKPIIKQSLPGRRDKTELTRDTLDEGIPRSPFRQSKSSRSNLNAQQQQRLETFAEYEATWNMQKKTMERGNAGRFHSAENILDSSGTVCVHERSRSSPSADIHTRKTLPPKMSSSEHKDKRETCVIREQNPVSIPEAITLNIPQNEDVANPPPPNQTPRPDSTDPSPLSSHHLQVPVSGKLCPKNTGTEYQRPVWSREETPTHLETTEPTQGASPVRKTPEPTQSFTRLCSSPCHTETLEREMCLTSEDGEGEFSLVLPVLGHISVSSQQNTDVTVTSDNRTHSPSPVFFTRTITDEAHVKKTHPDIGCKFEETSETDAAGQKLNIQNDSERGSSGGCEENKTAQLKNSSTHQSSSEHQTNDRTELLNTSDPTQRSEDDLKREELARDIMGKDKSLVDILDQSKLKTTMDLMEGIFPQGEHIQQRRKNTNKHVCVKNTQMRLEESLTASVSLLSTSSYYSTSAPKAELLIKMKDMQEHINQHDSEEELDSDLSNKKQELMDSLSRKLQVLREARASLRDDD